MNVMHTSISSLFLSSNAGYYEELVFSKVASARGCPFFLSSVSEPSSPTAPLMADLTMVPFISLELVHLRLRFFSEPSSVDSGGHDVRDGASVPYSVIR
jgi:hypothetical protein